MPSTIHKHKSTAGHGASSGAPRSSSDRSRTAIARNARVCPLNDSARRSVNCRLLQKASTMSLEGGCFGGRVATSPVAGIGADDMAGHSDGRFFCMRSRMGRSAAPASSGATPDQGTKGCPPEREWPETILTNRAGARRAISCEIMKCRPPLVLMPCPSRRAATSAVTTGRRANRDGAAVARSMQKNTGRRAC